MAAPPPTRYKVLKVFGRGVQLVRQSSQVFSLQTIILRERRRLTECVVSYTNQTVRWNSLEGLGWEGGCGYLSWDWTRVFGAGHTGCTQPATQPLLPPALTAQRDSRGSSHVPEGQAERIPRAELQGLSHSRERQVRSALSPPCCGPRVSVTSAWGSPTALDPSAWSAFTWAECPFPLPCGSGIKWYMALLRGFYRNTLSWTLLLLESSCPTWNETEQPNQVRAKACCSCSPRLLREESEQRTCRNSCSWLRDSNQWQGFIFNSSWWIFVHCSSSDGGRRVESNWRFPNTSPFSLYPHTFIHISVL